MSRKALVPVNVLAKASAPSGQYAGDVYYNSTDLSVFVYTGEVWNAVGAGAIDGGTPTSNYTSNPVVNGGTP
jgi:hypothetical protein